MRTQTDATHSAPTMGYGGRKVNSRRLQLTSVVGCKVPSFYITTQHIQGHIDTRDDG